MSLRSFISIGAGVILVGVSGCAKQSDFEKHVADYQATVAALETWFGTPSTGEGSPYTTFYEWAERISNVVCDLEDIHRTQGELPSVYDELCDDDQGDPKSPPPPPPELDGE